MEAPNIGAVLKTSIPPRERQIHPIHQPPDLVSLYLDLFWQVSDCPIWPQILCQFGPVHLLSPLAIFSRNRSAKLCQNGLPDLSGFNGYLLVHSSYTCTETMIALNPSVVLYALPLYATLSIFLFGSPQFSMLNTARIHAGNFTF